MTDTRPAHRPSLYRPEYCDEVIANGAEGLSLTAFAANIRVSRRTLTNWSNDNPEFADACDVALALACRCYEIKMHKIVDGEGGPGAASVAMFAIKNFGGFDFRERREVEHVGRVDHRHLTFDQAVEEAKIRGLPVRVLQEIEYDASIDDAEVEELEADE